MTYIWPLAGALELVTQEYGGNRNSAQPGGHTGMDFRARIKGVAGDPIYAEADGVIAFATWADDLGWPNPYYIATTRILPKPGSTRGGGGIVVGLDVGPYLFIHAHCSRTDLNPGDRVKQGDIIGYMGATGYSFGVHLHLDVLPNGWNVHSADNRYGRINPRDVIDGQAAVKPQGDVVKANQRVTGALGVKRRSAPDKNSQELEVFGKELILTLRGHVRATDPYGDGNNVWFVGALGTPTYFHSSGFTNMGTDGLPDITNELFPPAPPPPVVVPPVVERPPLPDPALPPEVYDFPLDFAVVNGITVEKVPADIGNVDVGNFPNDPDTGVCHWWNSLDKAPSFDSVLSEFRRKGAYKSAHFVVDETRIAQMVSLKDRAYHAGPGGNGWFGVEISPYATQRGADGQYTAKALRIQANVRALWALVMARRNRTEFRLVLHKQVPGAATACSDLELATLQPLPPVVVPPVVIPPVIPPVVVVPPVPQFPGLDDTIGDLVRFYGGK